MLQIGRRVIVTGSTCSGKSTLAATLAERLGLPFVELDALFWEPNWTEPDDEAFRERVREATAGDEWVVAGNYFGRTHDVTWPRAETVVYLDYPLRTIVPRVVRRSWSRSRNNELLWGTNYERFWHHLYRRDSLILWAFRSVPTLRQRWLDVTTDPARAHLRFVRLCSPAETDRWLEAVTREPVTQAAP